MMIEPKLLAPEVARDVPGAKETVFAAGRETEYGGLRYYDRAEFESLGLTWEAFLARARESADRTMEALEPEYMRNEQGVIEYAVLRSKGQRTAGVILGEAFRKAFRKSLGEELVVAIPDRSIQRNSGTTPATTIDPGGVGLILEQNGWSIHPPARAMR